MKTNPLPVQQCENGTPAVAGLFNRVNRRTAMNMLVTVPAAAAIAPCAVASPSIVQGDDPIYAAIENYRRAAARHAEMCHSAAELEAKLWAEHRAIEQKIDAIPDEDAGLIDTLGFLKKKHPEAGLDLARSLLKHIAVNELETDDGKALKAETERLHTEGDDLEYYAYTAMLATVPHSVGGALALLSFMIEEGRKGQATGGSLASLDFEADEDERAPQFMLLKSLHDCLEGHA